MSGVTIKVDQTEYRRLLGKIQSLDKDFNKSSLRKIFIKSAAIAVDAIKNEMHFGPDSTGVLERSIGIIPNVGGQTGSVFVGVRKERGKKKLTTFYGKFLEFGSKHIPKGKFTFLEPGVRASLDRVRDSIIDQLKQIVNRYGK